MSRLKILAQRYRLCVDAGEKCLESKFGYVNQNLNLDVKETALILVDVWNLHYVDSWIARATEITKTKIVPATEAARKAGMTIIHAPSPKAAIKYAEWTRYAGDEELNPATQPSLDWPPEDFRKRTEEYAKYSRDIWKEPYMAPWKEIYKGLDISNLVKPKPGDFIIATGNQLHRLLRDRKILHLFYAGFATNMCLIYRDYGMRAMKGKGYNLILLRDATTAVETHDTVANLLTTKVYVQQIELYAYSVTTEDFIKACQTIISK